MFHSEQKYDNLLCSTPSRAVVGPILLPMQWVSEALSLELIVMFL
jgi:hypothetical protein